MTRVAWIGLGRMGLPMSTHLVSAGFDVRGYDITEAALDRASAAGVSASSLLAEALEGADIVVTMLPHGNDVADVFLREGGVFDSAPETAIMIDSSTIPVATCQQLHDTAHMKNRSFLDAPVSGGTVGAEAGTLTFMVGGAEEVFEQARRVIEPMASNIFHTGGATTGQIAKICNNLILLINLASTAEGAVLAERLGLDPRVFWEIASVSSADSWPLRNWYPIPGVVPESAASRGFSPPTFTTRLAHKDVGLALQAAQSINQDLTLGPIVYSMLEALIDKGNGDKDCSAISTLMTK